MKALHQPAQLLRLLVHAAGGRRALLDQGRILQRHLIQSAHRRMHLPHAIALGRHTGIDTVHHRAGAVNCLHHFAHGAAGRIHQPPPIGHTLHRILNQLFNLPRCLGAALGQFAHLGRNHGKTTPLLTRPGRLNRRIQGQDIGLKRNAVNHAGDVGNFFTMGMNVLHRRHHFPHHCPATLGHTGRLAGQLGRLLRPIRRGLQGLHQCLHSPCRLLQMAGGLLCAQRQIVVATCNFRTGQSNRVATITHLTEHLRQRATHALHRLQQLAKFVLALHLHRHGQIPCGNLPCHSIGLQQVAPDAINQLVSTQRNEGQQNQHVNHGTAHHALAGRSHF